MPRIKKARIDCDPSPFHGQQLNEMPLWMRARSIARLFQHYGLVAAASSLIVPCFLFPPAYSVSLITYDWEVESEPDHRGAGVFPSTRRPPCLMFLVFKMCSELAPRVKTKVRSERLLLSRVALALMNLPDVGEEEGPSTAKL